MCFLRDPSGIHSYDSARPWTSAKPVSVSAWQEVIWESAQDIYCVWKEQGLTHWMGFHIHNWLCPESLCSYPRTLITITQSDNRLLSLSPKLSFQQRLLQREITSHIALYHIPCSHPLSDRIWNKRPLNYLITQFSTDDENIFPGTFSSVMLNVSGLKLWIKVMTSTLINKPPGWYISSVLLWWHRSRRCPVCPTVPDLCCFARIPWHLPDTIMPSSLEWFHQCGMIWTEFVGWSCARRKCSFQQMTAASLGHIYSYVCQDVRMHMSPCINCTWMISTVTCSFSPITKASNMPTTQQPLSCFWVWVNKQL